MNEKWYYFNYVLDIFKVHALGGGGHIYYLSKKAYYFSFILEIDLLNTSSWEVQVYILENIISK